MNRLEKININKSEQWVLVRGKKADAPLILQVQAGPGLPLICDADALQKTLRWEDDYLVAYWDQRGCGKSYASTIDPATISLTQAADDILACADYLRKTYRKDQIIILGYSFGATAALLAASRNSTLFSQLFLVGIDIHIPQANAYALNFAEEQARKTGNRKALAEIGQLRDQPIVTAALFQKRAKLLTNLGGIVTHKTYNQLFRDTVRHLIASRAYSLLDILRTVRGMNFCQNALLPKVDQLNLFESPITTDVPVHFIQGAHDAVAPLPITQAYVDAFPGGHKTLTVFEHAAHLPHLEEPERFYEALRSYTEGYVGAGVAG